MTIKEMYRGIANSPETTITNDINNTDTIIYVLDETRVPDELPNIMVLGTGISAETIKVLSIDDNAITVERGFQGAPRTWNAGTVIARNFTEYDYNTLIENIEELDTEKTTADVVGTMIENHNTDENAHEDIRGNIDEVSSQLNQIAKIFTGDAPPTQIEAELMEEGDLWLVRSIPITSGLHLRFDASVIKNLSDEGIVRIWKDISGNDLHAVAPYVGKEPRYRLHGLNEMPAIQFIALPEGVSNPDEAFNVLVTPEFQEIEQPVTIFFVAQPTNADRQTLIDGGSLEKRINFNIRNSDNVLKYRYNAGTHIATKEVDGLAHIFETVLNSENSLFLVDGVNEHQANPSSNPGSNSLDRVVIGGSFQLADWDESATYQGSNCMFAEILVYNRELTVAERAEVRHYLQNKWRL